MELPTLAVVVPARNEEKRLARCLESIIAADDHLRAVSPPLPPTRIVVVLDRCTDRSRAVVDDWPTVEPLSCEFGNVGAARAAGVDYLIGTSSCPSRRKVPDWIACTDADSAVPSDWLQHQLSHARADTDLLLGMVRPDSSEMTPGGALRWLAAHQPIHGHPHVHGANLGIRTRMYRRAGGFPALAEHEDVALAERVRTIGGRVVSTASSPVLTSARTRGRTPGGMAGYLAALSSD